MKTMIVLMAVALLCGCSQSEKKSSSPNPIIGMPGFELGAELPQALAPTQEKEGGYFYMNMDYTNIPPFGMLEVSANSARKIYCNTLMVHASDDLSYDAKRMVREALEAKYGQGETKDGDAWTDLIFRIGKREIDLRTWKKLKQFEITYMDTAMMVGAVDARIKNAENQLRGPLKSL